MTWVIFALCFLFNPYEGWTDRKGEKRKDKRKDTVILVVASVILTGASYLFVENWVAVPLLILMLRVTMFDYIAHAFLKRYSPTHKEKNINIWQYSGTTTHFWDQLVGKIPWKLRLVIRVILFIGTVLLYIKQSR